MMQTLLALSLGLPAVQAEDPFLARFVGKWRGEGRMFGMDVDLKVSHSWVLHRRFLYTAYAGRSKDGKWNYEGHGYLRPLEGNRYQSIWIDSKGMVYQNTLIREGDRLTLMIRVEGKEERVVKVLREKGYDEEFFVKAGEKWNPAGIVTYRPADPLPDLLRRAKDVWEAIRKKIGEEKSKPARNRGHEVADRVHKKMMEKIARGDVKNETEMKLAYATALLEVLKEMGIKRDDKVTAAEKEAMERSLKSYEEEWKRDIRKKWGKK